MSQSSNPSNGGDGSYVVVARRYRPRGFNELVGQEHVGRALKNAIETGRVGHAYLFTGARGVGKTSTARIFAKALNDPSGPTATPDNETDVALAIDAGEDVDVIEIDGASNRGIDEIRSLRANVGVRPSRCRYKIYIIDEVHMLTAPAFNALLKTLEEPPDHVKFIFCTTDPEKMPITVLSRCQRFDFAPVEVPKIVERLAEIVRSESAEADEAALELIARRAAGSMRDSQSLLEQVLSFSEGKLTADQVHTMLGTADDERLHALAKAMADRNAAETIAQVDAAIDAGVDAGRLAEQLLSYFRDIMAAAVGCDASLMRHTATSMHAEITSLGQTWGLQTVLAIVELLDQTLVRIGRSVQGRVLLEAAMIQICNLPDLQHIVDLAAAASEVGEKKKIKRPAKRANQSSESDRNPPTVEPAFNAVATPPNVSGHSTAVAGAGHSPSSTHDTGWSAAAPPAATVDAVADASALPAEPTGDLAKASVQDPKASVQDPKASVPNPVASGQDPAEPPVVAVAEAAAEPVDWTQDNVNRVWGQVLAGLEAMTETFARVVERVEPVRDNCLRLIFPAEAALALKRCQLPEHQSGLQAAVSRQAGKPIKLEFAAAPMRKQQKVEAAPVNRPSRQQRMREIEANPLIQSCIELFDAEIVRIDKARPQ
ncbi:DNA polymerase III subunit gamma/tau [Rubripirellula sp.]|nr:DNA polymerase III subunit gamma/tau [Rubripirellula sp.]